MVAFVGHLRGPSQIDAALRQLGELLAYRRERFEIVVIGGSALILLGYIERATRDVDLVALVKEGRLRSPDPLPVGLADAARAVARDVGLPDGWLNPGPAELLRFGLPAGFLDRCQVREYAALRVYLAGRLDHIHFKLYAAVDQRPRSKHLGDLEALEPDAQELIQAAHWARTHDPSDGFLQELKPTLSHFGLDPDDVPL